MPSNSNTTVTVQRPTSASALEKVDAVRWGKSLGNSQWPKAITPKVASASKADRTVKLVPMACFRKNERVSLAPCATLSDSIRLTNPEEALQMAASNPNERKAGE